MNWMIEINSLDPQQERILIVKVAQIMLTLFCNKEKKPDGLRRS
jgi:hypothetical protein